MLAKLKKQKICFAYRRIACLATLRISACFARRIACLPCFVLSPDCMRSKQVRSKTPKAIKAWRQARGDEAAFGERSSHAKQGLLAAMLFQLR
jgi:hypothetical protein